MPPFDGNTNHESLYADPADSASGGVVVGYRLFMQRYDDSSGLREQWTELDIAYLGTNTTHVATNLDPDIVYIFTVVATNIVGDSGHSQESEAPITLEAPIPDSSVAETLRPHIRDAADAETLDVLQHGIRRGTVLSRALATQLGRKPATWQVMPVSKIIDDVVAIGHKHAVRCGIEIESRIDSDASVRLDAAEGVHGVMQVLLFCVSRSVSKISVVCSVGPASIAGGRDREVARIKITGSPVSAEVSEFVVSVLTDNEGVLRAFGDSQSEDSGLVQAAIAAARAGGQLTVTAVDEGVAFDFVWPSV